MQRFYIEGLNTTNYNYTLDNKDIIHQISKVLRSKVGNEVIFFDGIEKRDYIFRIKEIQNSFIDLEQIGNINKESELPFDINLFQALPNKFDKIEDIVKNGTQIGVSNFLFYKSKRSQKLNISENKIKRLEKIIIEAAEQSGRNFIPKLIIEEFSFQIKGLEGKNIFLHTKNIDSKTLKEIDIDNEVINLFVGPEGGFSDEEVEKFSQNGFLKVYLGERILRTELAGITSCFYLLQNI